MPTLLPTDADNNIIPALRLRPAGAHAIVAGGTSARNAIAFNSETRIISVFATVPVYLNFGDATVTAASSSHYFPDGIYYDFAIGGETSGHYSHLAVIQASTGGMVYISEKE